MVTLTSVLRILKIMSLRLQPTCWCSLWKKRVADRWGIPVNFKVLFLLLFFLPSFLLQFLQFRKTEVLCVCVNCTLIWELVTNQHCYYASQKNCDGAEEEINHFGLVVMNWRNEILSSSCQKVWFWDLGVEWGVLNGTIIFIAWGEGSLENDAIYTLNLEAIDWELYFESCKKHGVLVLSCLPKLTFLCRFTWFLW